DTIRLAARHLGMPGYVFEQIAIVNSDGVGKTIGCQDWSENGPSVILRIGSTSVRAARLGCAVRPPGIVGRIANPSYRSKSRERVADIPFEEQPMVSRGVPRNCSETL